MLRVFAANYGMYIRSLKVNKQHVETAFNGLFMQLNAYLFIRFSHYVIMHCFAFQF